MQQGLCFFVFFVVVFRQNLEFAPKQTNDAAYKTSVQPKLEYVAPIWHPHVKTNYSVGKGAEDSCQLDLQVFPSAGSIFGWMTYKAKS